MSGIGVPFVIVEFVYCKLRANFVSKSRLNYGPGSGGGLGVSEAPVNTTPSRPSRRIQVSNGLFIE